MTKPELLAQLAKIADECGGDQEATHIHAEAAILEFIGDVDISAHWADAAQFWWYA